MPAKKRIVLWALLSVLLLIALAAAVPPVRGRVLGWWRGEAFFAGRPASLWSAELESDAEAAEHNPAFDELKTAGPTAVPVLMAIALSDTPARAQARQLLILQGETAVGPLTKLLAKGSAAEREQVALTLGDMGRHAKPAVSALVRLLDDDDRQVRRAAMVALENIGPYAVDAVPDLVLIIERKGTDTSTDWLAQAARALGKMGPAARQAVPALTGCFKSPDPQLNQEACLALAMMGKEAAPAVPKLIELLKGRGAVESRQQARVSAALALGKIGPAAKQAVPALTEALQDGSAADLRQASKVALARMGASACSAVPILVSTFGRSAPVAEIGSAAIPELIKLLASPTPTIQADAQYFLEALRKHAGPALLDAVQKDKNPAVRQRIIAILGPQWGEASTLLPTVVRALGDKDNSVRQAARESIVRFHKEAQPFLDQQLRGKDQTLRLEAVQLLGRLGTEARSSARALLAVLRDDDAGLHLAAVRALANMNYHPKEAVPVLIDVLKAKDMTVLPLLAAQGRGTREAGPLIVGLLRDPDWKTRCQAVQILQGMGVDKEFILPVLAKALADKNVAVRAAVAQALGSTRALADETVPILTKLLQDPAADVQAAAILALGQLDRAAKDAVPLIRKIAENAKEATGESSVDLRAACITALGGIGPPAQETAPLLISWLSTSKSEHVRLLIVEALGRMKAKGAAPVLAPLMRNNGDKLSVAAAVAVWRVEESPAALAFVQEHLKEKQPAGEVIVALGQIGPGAHQSVPALIQIMSRDPDLAQRARAAEALGRIGPAARPAIKLLTQCLRVSDPRLRISAARALGQFDEDAGDASSRLVDLLNDPESPAVRQAAADALLRIDPEAAANAGL